MGALSQQIWYISRNGLQDQEKPKKTYGHKPFFKYVEFLTNSDDDISTPKEQNDIESEERDCSNVLFCFKRPEKHKCKCDEVKKEEHNEDKSSSKLKKRSKSREIISGVLHIGCACDRRNGLQDYCPRSECQGSRDCMTFPPVCGPSEYSQGVHMTKKFGELKKVREKVARMIKDDHNTSKEEKSTDQDDIVHYDCFPVNKLHQNNSLCPHYNKHFNKCVHSKPNNITIWPCLIQLQLDGLSCPGAS